MSQQHALGGDYYIVWSRKYSSTLFLHFICDQISSNLHPITATIRSSIEWHLSNPGLRANIQCINITVHESTDLNLDPFTRYRLEEELEKKTGFSIQPIAPQSRQFRQLAIQATNRYPRILLCSDMAAFQI
jgi:hypothetical protein